jgi:hypothetical protein
MRLAPAVILACLILLGSLFGLCARAEARVRVDVDLTSQRLQVTTPAGETYVWAISSGRRGYSTPPGTYSAYRLERVYFSRKYDNAPMPHAVFFRGGYAIHGTQAVRLLGRPASHGCIRLAPAHAAFLFNLVQRHGARIAIRGTAPDPARTDTAERPARLKQARPRPVPHGPYGTPQGWGVRGQNPQGYFYYVWQ